MTARHASAFRVELPADPALALASSVPAGFLSLGRRACTAVPWAGLRATPNLAPQRDGARA